MDIKHHDQGWTFRLSEDVPQRKRK